jgi:hypothetical protein
MFDHGKRERFYGAIERGLLAVLSAPPITTAPIQLAVLRTPPLTLARLALAVLATPPLTLAN